MKPSKMLKNLSLRLLSSSSSSMVVPFPIQIPFNHQLTSNLKTLSSLIIEPNNSSSNYLTMPFLAQALDALVATQKLAQESLDKSTLCELDREAIECYLDENVDLLDACNGLGDKMDNVRKYVESLRLALHLLHIGGRRFSPSLTTTMRANKLLESCQSMERQCCKMSRSNSGLKKLSNKITQRINNSSTSKNGSSEELEEILDGSSIVTSTMCEIFDNALSFKAKNGLKTTTEIIKATTPSSSFSWLYALQELRNNVKKGTKKSAIVWELQKIVSLVQDLRQDLKCQNYSELRVIVEELERSCDEVENGLKSLEEKVKELYRYLMCVRMALLGKLSSMA